MSMDTDPDTINRQLPFLIRVSLNYRHLLGTYPNAQDVISIIWEFFSMRRRRITNSEQKGMSSYKKNRKTQGDSSNIVQNDVTSSEFIIEKLLLKPTILL